MTKAAKPPKKVIFYDSADAGALICDEIYCGYSAQPQPFGEHLVGLPCPDCGSSLLTRRDYDSTVRMFAKIDRFNRWFGWLFGRREQPVNGKVAEFRLHNDVIIMRQPERQS